ncbi:MAG: hypothetical protein ACOYXR_13805 [Nitrospirota bacterium]
MKFLSTAIITFGIVFNTSLGIAGSTPASNAMTLGVPSYPGWTVHRLDDKVDSSGKTHLYQYQYYSNDRAPQIVSFYEERLNTKAAFMEPTATYTVNTPDGAMVQITAPADGVAQTDDAGNPTGKTWAALITIIRFQGQ